MKGGKMSKWLNTTHIQKGINNGEWNKFYKWLLKDNKPCHGIGYCPYGKLVEEFPLLVKKSKYSCKVFGHNCPVFYHAEPMAEIKYKNEWVGYIPEKRKEKK
jgi:hypothetical protein